MVMGTSTGGRAAFVRQLAWRTGTPHLLWELPSMSTAPYDPNLATSGGRTTRRTLRRGRRAAPAIPSSMPACASWPVRGGCTTGYAWPRPPSLSKTCSWTGGSGSDGSSSPRRCGTQPRTRATAMGGRDRARRRPVLPRLQSGAPVREVRSAGKLHRRVRA